MQKFTHSQQLGLIDDNRIETRCQFIHKQGMILILIDVFADGGPQDAYIFSIDKFLQHRLDFILTLSYFGMQEQQYFFNHKFKVIFFRLHDLNDLMYIFGIALVDLLHYLLYYLLHTRDYFALVVFKHKFHPVYRML